MTRAVMGEFFRRLAYLLRHSRADRELESEMEFHREMAAQAGGMRLGNVTQLREAAREAWGWTWIDRLLQDLRYALRILGRAPGFTTTSVLVLAIGIGVNITAFSLFNFIALKPLPVPNPQSIIRLERRSPEISTTEMPYPTVQFYREHAKTLGAVMAVMGTPPMQLERDVQPVSISFVTTNYFTELGTMPFAGRLLQPSYDETADAPPVAVLSYGFLQSHFAGDPSIVGKIIHLNRKPVTVIGVTLFTFASLDGQSSDIWLPLPGQPYFVEGSKALTDVSQGHVRMWARLASGASAKTASQELLVLTNQLRKIRPDMVWDKEYILVSAGGHLKVMRPEMFQVAAMVAFLTFLILTVACANLGGLLVARGVARGREIGIRLAIGASRTRIVRQLLTESVLVALLGAGTGLAASCVALRITLAAIGAPGWLSAVPDGRVLIFSLGISLTAAALFGFAPALQIARQRYQKTFVRQLLIAAQLAASCVLMIVSGLLVHALHRVLYTNPGFGYEQVLAISPDLGSHGYTAANAETFLNVLSERLRALPGVQSVSLSKIPILGHGLTVTTGVEIDGQPVTIYPNWVDTDFFRTMEIPLLRGRMFARGDKNVVIVSDSLARKEWPNQDPIGKPLWRDGTSKERIVGVAQNARVKSMNDGDAVELYLPAQSEDLPAMTLLVKTAGAPDGLPATVRTLCRRLDLKLFPSIWLLKSGFRETARDLEKLVLVVTLLGAIAIAIAAIGIIGLVAYAVSQQRKDIAIRLALGARPPDVLAPILNQFSWPLLVGLVSGGLLTGIFSKMLRKTLYGVSNVDPASYGVAMGLLLVLATIAALLPARRVLRINVSRTLHHQ